MSITDIGIGATDELSLRVSVATLVRVLFESPRDGEWMLALERKGTLLDSSAPAALAPTVGTDEAPGRPFVEVKSQPFGGAIQIRDPKLLRKQIGDFHFDSGQSRSEQDFRLFIRPSSWESVQGFCLEHLLQDDDPILESDPRRELAEEFAEALEIRLKPDQYIYKPAGMIVEDAPSPTENYYARGALTARVYRIFEVRIVDSSLAKAMMISSETCSNQRLQELALQNFQQGGPGWANAVLVLPLKQIGAHYSVISTEARNRSISFENHPLDETVAAVLEGIDVPKYRRL